MYNGKIPKQNGRIIHYAKSVGYVDGELHEYYDPSIEWFDNAPFEATIRLNGFISSGRSAKNLPVTITTQDEELKATMFVRDFLDVALEDGVQPGGIMTGTWAYCKRGQNYGVCKWRK